MSDLPRSFDSQLRGPTGWARRLTDSQSFALQALHVSDDPEGGRNTLGGLLGGYAGASLGDGRGSLLYSSSMSLAQRLLVAVAAVLAAAALVLLIDLDIGRNDIPAGGIKPGG
jgi:hypothetical protein